MSGRGLIFVAGTLPIAGPSPPIAPRPTGCFIEYHSLHSEIVGMVTLTDRALPILTALRANSAP